MTAYRASGAALSACGRWRYALWRAWADGGPTLNVIGLNPSTADATRDDPTVRRCVGFARRWGFGAVVVTNLFALRATRPAALRSARDPIGSENDAYLVRHAREAGLVLAAWGAQGELLARDAAVVRALDGVPLACIGRTRAGHPRHPLYARGDLLPGAYRAGSTFAPSVLRSSRSASAWASSSNEVTPSSTTSTS